MRYDPSLTIRFAVEMLDQVKRDDWKECWSEHDEKVRNGLVALLATPPAAQPTGDGAAFFRRYVAEASRIQLEQCCLRLRAKLDIFENAAVPVIGEFGVCDTCGRDFPDHWPNGACPQPERPDNGKILGYRIEAKGQPECFHLAESDFCYSDEIAIPLYAKSTQPVTPVEGKE